MSPEPAQMSRGPRSHCAADLSAIAAAVIIESALADLVFRTPLHTVDRFLPLKLPCHVFKGQVVLSGSKQAERLSQP